jgi:hypothetical protein
MSILGKIGSKGANEIIDFAERLMAKEAPKKAAERREAIKSSAEAEDIIINKINSDPSAMDDMPMSILENLSVKNKAKIGLADEYSSEIAESTGGMLKEMSPKEAAENLLAFEDDEIFDYMSTLNARDLRIFKDNLSDDDFEAFGDYMPDLGPRSKKSKGGLTAAEEAEVSRVIKANKILNSQSASKEAKERASAELKELSLEAKKEAERRTNIKVDIEQEMFSRTKKQEGGSMLVPPEKEKMPVDTYTPEEQANASKEQLPDGEMEEEYMGFIFDESLQSEEQEYLMSALESDPKLSDIFDKVLMTASEFSGSGKVEGPGTGVSDSIPARLSDGEFVITEKATSMLGADNLQKMMDDAERMADGGRATRQAGGLLESNIKLEEEEQKPTYNAIEKSMLYANQSPSLRGSRVI